MSSLAKTLLSASALATALVIAPSAGHAVPQGTSTSAVGQADPTIGTETTNGFVGPLFPGFAGYTVASDGEVPFQPFGATFDTSDGIQLNNPFNWFQAPDSNWTSLGNFTWVLPATIPGCGSENEPTCEPVGHFLSATPWNPGFIGTFEILDPNGGISDVIVTNNTAGGMAELRFSSDPLPEPATIALLGTGLFGLGVLRWRRRTS